MPLTGCEHYGDCRKPISKCRSGCTDYEKSGEYTKRTSVKESIKEECAGCHLFSGTDCMMPTPEFGCVRDLLARAEAAESELVRVKASGIESMRRAEAAEKERDKADATWMLALKEIAALKTERDHFAEHSKMVEAENTQLKEALFLAENVLGVACSNSPWEDECPCGGNISIEDASSRADRKCPILRARKMALTALGGGK